MINITKKILAFERYFSLLAIPPHPEHDIFVTRSRGVVNIPPSVLENKTTIVNVHRYSICYFAVTLSVRYRKRRNHLFQTGTWGEHLKYLKELKK